MPSTDLLEEKIRVILRATCLPTVAVVWGGGQDPPCTEQLVRGARTPGLCPVLSSLPAASSQLLPLREGLQQTKQKRPARRRGWCQTRNDPGRCFHQDEGFPSRDRSSASTWLFPWVVRV